MTHRIPVRSLTPERYAQCFSAFVARSGEYPAMVERLAALPLADGFACLDIGAGNGKVVRDWVARGGPRAGRYVALEPNGAHAAELRAALASLDLDGQVLEEEFAPDYAIAGTFDLVLFSHSLYWMRDPAACVLRAREALAPKGQVLAFLQAPFGIHPMHRLFEPGFVRDRPAGQNQGVSSAEVVAGLREAGVEAAVETDPTAIDLSGLFEPECRLELDDFVSFCLQIEFRELPEPARSDVIQYLRSACVDHDGRSLWYEPTAAVYVTRDDGRGRIRREG